jgi:pyruvate,orthophosphate dikinase
MLPSDGQCDHADLNDGDAYPVATAQHRALESATDLLTQRGARTSHTAVVACQLGKICLVGCEQLRIDDVACAVKVGETTLKEGDLLTLDGNEGAVDVGAV